MYYPTRTTETGKSVSAASRTDKNTYYGYTGSDKILATSNEYKMLFENKYYWLASRCVSSGSSLSHFSVHNVESGDVYGTRVGSGNSGSFYEVSISRGVCPIVYLKSDIQTSGKDSSGAWTIIEEK